MNKMNFGTALEALKKGKKVARQGWNGKGMFLYYVSEGAYPAKTDIAKEIADESGLVAYGAYIAIKSVSGVVYIWNPSQQDLFAEDWVVVENEEIIYFSVNNWFCGRDYPPTDDFKRWLSDDLNQTFASDKWAKENRLCINYGCIDMSYNYTIAAPRSWVEKNCPELLTNDEYTYVICSYGKDGEERKEYTKKYSDFVNKPDENGNVIARFGWPYLEYKEENFGCHWYEEPYEDEDEDDNNDELEDE